ncbi:MC25A protein, partial [Psilopogon haemacephalus]|nr:MC25A protein [Psilopogon haemacephalus]
MGGSESSQGGRKVSFGLDEREQVRVLQGIRLTEDVVNRMKESSQSKRDNQRLSHFSSGTAPSSPAAEGKPKSPIGTGSPCQSMMSHDPIARSLMITFSLCSYRYEQEQALVQEELLRLAKRESEALNAAVQRERSSSEEERQRAAQLVSNKTPQDVSMQD